MPMNPRLLRPKTSGAPPVQASLLMHFDGANGSTTFVDSSGNNVAVTAHGDAEISTAESKFGGASVYFDGNGDYLEFADSSNFQFDAGDFTIELWLRVNAVGQQHAFVTSGYGVNGDDSVTKGVLVYYDGPSDGFLFFCGSDEAGWDIAAGLAIAANPALETWHHLAVTRQGNTFRTFFNGTLAGSATSSLSVANAANVVWQIGPMDSNCYIDELRIVKGMAVYTANFTPPTAPF